jgi:hypothetical protein
MTQTQTAAHASEVHRTAVRTISRAIEDACAFFEDRTRDHLADHSLADVVPKTSYDLGDYVTVYDDLLASTGKHTVHRIGKELAYTATWDSDTDGVADALETLDDVYAQFHRGDAGGYAFELTGEESGRLVCKTPYPAAAERGFLRGVGQQFSNTGFLKADLVDQHREDGLRVTTFEVRWWASTDLGTGDLPTVDAENARSYAGAD